MKKRTIFIVMMIVLSIVVSSCSGNTNKKDLSYEAKIMDYSDNVAIDVDYGSLTRLYDEQKYKEVIPEMEISVSIAGREVTGKYYQTYNRPNNYYPYFDYMISDNSGSFSVDDKGRIVSYINHEAIEKVDKLLTDDEYVAIAKNFVESISGDEKIDWALFETTVTDGYYQEGFYTIFFDKYINEFQTAECIYVKISYSGIIRSFISDMLGRIPEGIDMSLIKLKDTEAAVCSKLDEIYKGLNKEGQDKCEIGYYIPEPILTVLEDGTIGYIYETNINFVFVEKGEEYVDLVKVIVTPSK